MSEEIARFGNIRVTKFYGGDNRGSCLSVQYEDRYLHLTRQDAAKLMRVLDKWLFKTRPKDLVDPMVPLDCCTNPYLQAEAIAEHERLHAKYKGMSAEEIAKDLMEENDE